MQPGICASRRMCSKTCVQLAFHLHQMRVWEQLHACIWVNYVQMLHACIWVNYAQMLHSAAYVHLGDICADAALTPSIAPMLATAERTACAIDGAQQFTLSLRATWPTIHASCHWQVSFGGKVGVERRFTLGICASWRRPGWLAIDTGCQAVSY